MALSALLHIKPPPPPFPSLKPHLSSSKHPIQIQTPKPLKAHFTMQRPPPHASTATTTTVHSAVSDAVSLIQSSPATWKSAILCNLVIFVLGSPVLVSGLSLSGIAAAFLLGNLTWRAFGPPGFLLVATYFVIGTAVTKVRMAQKEAEGVAEKRKGRRGPGSVIGSSAAGCVCAFLTIFLVGGKAYSRLWQLGFVSSFCTKLSDTVSSEVGKAYGKTTQVSAFGLKLAVHVNIVGPYCFLRRPN